jgi:DNA-binding response OmpR family regulator
VVEDDQTMRAILRRLLTVAGYRVAEAPDGIAALTSLQATAPDLVLLDIMLPDIDGLEVARRIRAEPTVARLPIIMLTGLLPAAEAVQGFAAGADDYVRKPFYADELLARVRRLLRPR